MYCQWIWERLKLHFKAQGVWCWIYWKEEKAYSFYQIWTPTFYPEYCPSHVIARHNLNSLFYADDTQLCIAIDPANQAPSLTALQTCIEDVMRWNTQNMLKSNAEKTEVILFTSRFTKTPNIEKLFFDSTVIELTEKVRHLGVTVITRV